MVMLVMVMGGELAAAKSRVAQVEEGGPSRFFKTLPTLPQVDALIRFSNSHISFSNSSYETQQVECIKHTLCWPATKYLFDHFAVNHPRYIMMKMRRGGREGIEIE